MDNVVFSGTTGVCANRTELWALLSFSCCLAFCACLIFLGGMPVLPSFFSYCVNDNRSVCGYL